MSRPSDAIKQHNSFVVQSKAGGDLFVKPSHFAVGYTPAYCETELEAIQYALKKRESEMDKLHDEYSELIKMKLNLS